MLMSTDEQADRLARYGRQMILPGWGRGAQERVAGSHAVIVGMGALGCQSADLLVRAGVGKVTLIDRDLVEWTNLQRQCLYSEQDAAGAVPKAQAAAARLGAINSGVEVRAVVADMTGRNALELVAGADVLVDGTDNFETRYLLNDVAVKMGVAFAYAGVIAARGMQMTVLPRGAGGAGGVVTPCLRCVFEELPAPGTTATCDTAGVFGPAVAIVAGAQAADVLKVLAGRLDLLSHSLLEFDLWANTRRRLDLMALGAREGCVCCGERRFEFLDGTREGESVVLCGQNAVQVTPGERVEIDLGACAERWRSIGEVSITAFMARVRLGEGVELSLFGDGRAIVRGTTSTATARSVYARLVGG